MNKKIDNVNDWLLTRILAVNSHIDELDRLRNERKTSIKANLVRIRFHLKAIRHRSLEYSAASETPPQFAKYLIYLLIPRNNREAILGDLEEDFHEVKREFGLRKAKFHYRVQVLRSIWPMIKGMVFNLLIITKKLFTS
jgi:hypothetical protein